MYVLSSSHCYSKQFIFRPFPSFITIFIRTIKHQEGNAFSVWILCSILLIFSSILQFAFSILIDLPFYEPSGEKEALNSFFQEHRRRRRRMRSYLKLVRNTFRIRFWNNYLTIESQMKLNLYLISYIKLNYQWIKHKYIKGFK